MSLVKTLELPTPYPANIKKKVCVILWIQYNTKIFKNTLKSYQRVPSIVNSTQAADKAAPGNPLIMATYLELPVFNSGVFISH